MSEDSDERKSYLSETISREWTDAILIAACFTTGLLDSAVLNTWGCFTCMQTGNTIYVGLGVTGQPYSSPWRWAKSGTSILAFVLGSFIFGRIMRFLGPTRRSTLTLSALVQAGLVITAALLSTLGVVSDAETADTAYIVLLPLSLLALQAGGQCVWSRVLGYGELPTVVLTAALCDVGMDEKLFQGISSNSKRNRRILSIVMLVGGAALGGFMTKTGEVQWALWVVAGIKIVMAFAWMIWASGDSAIQLD